MVAVRHEPTGADRYTTRKVEHILNSSILFEAVDAGTERVRLGPSARLAFRMHPASTQAG
jgi:alkanesulfonate monooxygenase SsuD/methylene tetrahydromethanopterin reductase-like flavin-dependent oxidoreductase (luciferase family)